MKVKVCGIRSYEDARAALDAGAWALGFVFHRASPRSIDPEVVERIVSRLPGETLTVGVFVDYPLAELNAIVHAAGLKGAQLHGDEDPAYAERVKAETVIKAFRVGEGFALESLREFPRQRILLDAYSPSAPGGTGKTCDWSLARRAAELRPVILAGGLRPENVAEALSEVRPDALDVSTGVESVPGVKDPEKLRRLFEAVGRWESAAASR